MCPLTAQAAQAATDTTDSNGAPPSYNEAFDMRSTTPPSYNALFMVPKYAGIFVGTTRLILVNQSAHHNGYSLEIHDDTGHLRAKVNTGPIHTSATDVNGQEIFKFSKVESDDLKRQGIDAFEMRDKDSFLLTIKVARNGRSIQLIHKYSDPKLIVGSIKTGQFAVFRGDMSTNPFCNVHITKSFKRGEVSGSIKFHTETDISTLEQLLCTAAAIALKIVVKKEERKKCPCYCVAIAIFCFIIFLVAILTYFYKREKTFI